MNRLIPIVCILVLTSLQLIAEDQKHLTIKAQSGDGAYALMTRYQLSKSSCNLQYFKEINNLGEEMALIINKTYHLPIFVYKYNATSIRSTIDINDWELAKKIQAYNENAHKAGLRDKDYREDNVLWVPYEILECGASITTKETLAKTERKEIIYPLLGKKYEKVEVKDQKLANHVYYIVAGHGGPDPGAMGKYNGKTLCEDEYAYDIALRMVKNLLEHNATVYMIVQDKNDGIRNEAVLAPDKDEKSYYNKTIPINQIARLNQRCDEINRLYKEHKNKGAKKQRALILHVDSRGKGQRVDMFFYYNSRSKTGKKLAITMKNTIAEKYNKYQKNRGYTGTVKARNLHLLRETHPVAVFVELGNIRNAADQKRFIIEDNRQAVANWLVDGLMNEK